MNLWRMIHALSGQSVGMGPEGLQHLVAQEVAYAEETHSCYARFRLPRAQPRGKGRQCHARPAQPKHRKLYTEL